jgi:hypothetical protein
VVFLRRYCASALVVFAVGTGAVGCAESSAVGPSLVDPSGHARTWGEDILGVPINFAFAIRIPADVMTTKGSSMASLAWLANDGADGRIDLLGSIDGTTPKGWLAAAPAARADAFDTLLAMKDTSTKWDSPVTLSSGVREACISGSKIFQACLFGFPDGGLVLVDSKSADRARDVFSRSSSAPPALAIADNLYVSAWNNAPTLPPDTKLKPEEARMVDGLVAGTMTLDTEWKLTVTGEYSDATHAQNAEDAHKKIIADSLHDASSTVMEILRSPVFDGHVDGSRYVFAIDFKTLVTRIADLIKNAFSTAISSAARSE